MSRKTTSQANHNPFPPAPRAGMPGRHLATVLRKLADAIGAADPSRYQDATNDMASCGYRVARIGELKATQEQERIA